MRKKDRFLNFFSKGHRGAQGRLKKAEGRKISGAGRGAPLFNASWNTGLLIDVNQLIKSVCCGCLHKGFLQGIILAR